MVFTDVIEPDEAYQYVVVDYYGAYLYEQGYSGFVEAVVSTGVTEVETKEV